MSRKYAYQVLLTEEFARHGVETIFLKAPHSGTPEDQLMLQFQGMIAEYERAQILERSRRGKRHRAKAGEVSVLCGAPMAIATFARPAMRRHATRSTPLKRRSCDWCTTNIPWMV
nr:recombinase family protein [Rhizobium sp. T136]